MENRVLVVHMTSSLVTRFFLKAKEAGMMSEGYVWIVTAGTMNLLDSFDMDVIEAMQGVLGVKLFNARSERLENFTLRWKKAFREKNSNLEGADHMNIVGLWAYDTAWALAMAAETVGVPPDSNFHETNVTRNSTELDSISISQTGPKLLNAILETRFSGLTGEFHLVDRQLQPSTFQLLNVIGKWEKVIGFWNPELGITRELNMNTSVRMYSTSSSAFRYIIWPGESMVIPKGWVIPVSGNKLRIAVPVNIAYTEFVNVEWDNQHNITDYDVVVGDTTILSNRSLYVDFTLPYTEGRGVPDHEDIREEEVLDQVPLDTRATDPAFYGANGSRSVRASGLDILIASGTQPTAPPPTGEAPILQDILSKLRTLREGQAELRGHLGKSTAREWELLRRVDENIDRELQMWRQFREMESRPDLESRASHIWLAILAFFILIGLLVWFLEDQRKNKFRGSPSQQIQRIFHFSLLTTLVFGDS
ncbi:glutamate receptor 2.2-like [Macadamia integrifolia]|uniref:glutamate receptor 2.2-like n=1 Tax=Macadamia integrifolia TaxID=60698 RepID=UPI001C532E1E|nr:glutamate receptor 2.2-like [Macadamia integrifolia]